MATESPTAAFNALRRTISSGKLAPVYLIHGEQGYFVDRLVEDFEALVPEDERDFNLYILYGPETTPERVIETCQRYPMMAERVVVILKEAQSMRADQLNKLATYIERPNPSTLLVIACRGAQAKGKDLSAALKKGGGVNFESKRIYDNQIATIIRELIKEKGLNIEPKGLTMLSDFIGTDIAKIYNEIEKLAMILGPGAMVTPEAIERNIGISKDYNNYELCDALGARDAKKAYSIVAYFTADPNGHPIKPITAALFNYFANLIILQFNRGKSPAELAQLIGQKSAWQLDKNYGAALRNYNAFQTMEIISAIRDLDAKSVGIGSRQSGHALLKDLVFHILTAPGKITL